MRKVLLIIAGITCVAIIALQLKLMYTYQYDMKPQVETLIQASDDITDAQCNLEDQLRTTQQLVHGDLENDGNFYIVSVEAVKNASDAIRAAENLGKKGYETGYLWIPNYRSLSGTKMYCVFIGPFYSKSKTEKMVEKYRKVNPKAFGLLVSKENKRIEIKGVGKSMTTEPYHIK